MKAIDLAGAAVGVLCKDGVVLAGERKVTSKLLAPLKSGTSEKMYKIDEHIACTVLVCSRLVRRSWLCIRCGHPAATRCASRQAVKLIAHAQWAGVALL